MSDKVIFCVNMLPVKRISVILIDYVRLARSMKKRITRRTGDTLEITGDAVYL